MATTSSGTLKELVITRVFDAPLDLVWRAWTEPALLARWWGPRGFSNPRCELEAKPGGRMHIDMRHDRDGAVYPMTGTVREAVREERLVFTNNALDAAGAPMIEGLTTVTFERQGGRTKVTVRATISKATTDGLAALEGMEQGWNESLDKLAEELAKEAR